MNSPTDALTSSRPNGLTSSPSRGPEATVVAAPVRFEACAEFEASADDALVCACGWFETDHGELADARRIRARRRLTTRPPQRRAS